MSIRLLAGEKRELFYAICLNGQMETLGDALIAKGSLSDVPAYPRVVMDAVLTHNAHGVLFCHNHPGGTIAPHDGAGPLHMAFAAGPDDLPAWRARLAAHGVAVEAAMDWPQGGQSIYFRDPDGHCLELASRGLWPGVWPAP